MYTQSAMHPGTKQRTEYGTHYGERIRGDKWMYQRDNMDAILNGCFYRVNPVTVQIAPTLRCNHRCYFCNYGNVKGDGHSTYDQSALRTTVRDMPSELMNRVIDELAANRVKAIIFTGGGEPTLYEHLADAMRHCRDHGLKFALNTNGQKLTPNLLDRIVPLAPSYIRVSLNAGTPETQKLITGCPDFEQVLENVEWLARKKAQYQSSMGISVGYVVDVVNAHDIPNLIGCLRRIEIALQRDDINFDLALLVRPAVNYENGKFANPKRISQVMEYLDQHHGEDDKLAYAQFMHGKSQYPLRVFEQALDSIDNEVIPFLKNQRSRIEVNYPRQRFLDLSQGQERRYDRCRALPWLLFVWPDGTVYPCIEWAGTPGFESGSLKKDSLQDILTGDLHRTRFDMINREVLHSRCPATCSRHEMNMRLADIASRLEQGEKAAVKMMIEQRTLSPAPDHIDFL